MNGDGRTSASIHLQASYKSVLLDLPFLLVLQQVQDYTTPANDRTGRNRHRLQLSNVPLNVSTLSSKKTTDVIKEQFGVQNSAGSVCQRCYSRRTQTMIEEFWW